MEQYGVGRGLTLRHCFSTHQLEKGTNIIYKEELLGQFNIKTNER